MSPIADFSLDPGTVLCLHLPSGSLDPFPEVVFELLQLARRRSMRVVVARDVEPFHDGSAAGENQSCVEWLGEAAGISKEESAAIIRGFGIRVAPLLRQIAANPRRFLGVAAARARRPAVLVYETSGMDPVGVFRLHEYIEQRGADLCAVYLSYRTQRGTGAPAPRSCPLTAQCVELDDNS